MSTTHTLTVTIETTVADDGTITGVKPVISVDGQKIGLLEYFSILFDMHEPLPVVTAEFANVENTLQEQCNEYMTLLEQLPFVELPTKMVDLPPLSVYFDTGKAE